MEVAVKLHDETNEPETGREYVFFDGLTWRIGRYYDKMFYVQYETSLVPVPNYTYFFSVNERPKGYTLNRSGAQRSDGSFNSGRASSSTSQFVSV